jgi:FMN hydrolase / 5-amino-6-(5-phospho-D-ribitylamino)uracil phosphatase
MISKIRAIAFDLDDTLWDIEPVMTRAERSLLNWMREHCPRIPERFSPEDMRAARALLAKQEPHRAHDFAYLRKSCMTAHARECGYDEVVALRATDIFYTARNTLELYSDVLPALGALKQRFVLGTLSNGNADLVRIGLSHFFTVSLNACSVGVPKPHPESFARLISALGVEPHEVLYVGDDPALDVVGARAAGLRAAWMNRRRAQWPDDLRVADIVVRDCSELVALCAERC